MNNSNEKRSITKCICPNLIEWQGWRKPVCRLRYRVSDDLTSAERSEFCENKDYEMCVFYAEQIKQCAAIYSENRQLIQ